MKVFNFNLQAITPSAPASSKRLLELYRLVESRRSLGQDISFTNYIERKISNYIAKRIIQIIADSSVDEAIVINFAYNVKSRYIELEKK